MLVKESVRPRVSSIEAGRRGGLSRSAKKMAACRLNGFQKSSTVPNLAKAKAYVVVYSDTGELITSGVI
jgi:hypothetical protein